jgi:hypothetical protein
MSYCVCLTMFEVKFYSICLILSNTSTSNRKENGYSLHHSSNQRGTVVYNNHICLSTSIKVACYYIDTPKNFCIQKKQLQAIYLQQCQVYEYLFRASWKKRTGQGSSYSAWVLYCTLRSKYYIILWFISPVFHCFPVDLEPLSPFPNRSCIHHHYLGAVSDAPILSGYSASQLHMI